MNAPVNVIVRRVADHLGFALSAPQRHRLERTARRLQHDRQGALAAAVPGTPTFEELIESVLVGETYWFRDPAQLDAVVEILAAVEPARRRVWSAGAATGQEAWSLAITLHRAGIWPVEIVASDISATAVRAARVADYPLARQRGLDPATAAAYGTATAGVWSLRTDLRGQVTVVHHDLLRDPPFPATVIMCRNVLIYLTPQAVARALEQFDRGLAPHGTLVLGHSESQLPGTRWRAARLGGAFVFTRTADIDLRPDRRGTDMDRVPIPQTPAVPAADSATSPADAARDPDHAPRADCDVADDDADALLRAGEAALSSGAHEVAIGLMRRVRYLRGSDPVPAVVLGIALDRAGHRADARRSWTVAATLLEGMPEDAGLVGGYPPAAVRRWVGNLLQGDLGP